MSNRPDYTREDVLREAKEWSKAKFIKQGRTVEMLRDYAALLARVEQFRKVLQSPLEVETTESRAYAKRLDVLDGILRGTHD